MTDGIQLAPIGLRKFEQPDRNKVQAAVVEAVQENPALFLDRYNNHPESFNGRYIAADLFKETFEEFSQSKEARGRYNAPVHNAAAVLSAEQFKQVLGSDKIGGEYVMFLTGIPGAGKTSAIIRAGELPDGVKMVFEGQLINPQTSIEKIGAVLDAGLKPLIVVVHPTPENALDNTFQRFVEYGRGAGIGVMADIQGGLPQGLEAIREKFGDQVKIEIKDVRDRSAIKSYYGWENLDILRSEGNREQIYERLSNAVEQQRQSGRITEGAYEQAFGRVVTGTGLLFGEDGQGYRRNAPGRERAPGSGETSVIAEIDQGILKQARTDVAGLSASAILPLLVEARGKELALADQINNPLTLGSSTDALAQSRNVAVIRVQALERLLEQRQIAETPSEKLTEQIAKLREQLADPKVEKGPLLNQINLREAALQDRSLGLAMIPGLALPDKTQAERLKEISQLDSVMSERGNMQRALSSSFKDASGVAAKVDALLEQAAPGQERAHVAKAVLSEIKNFELRGGTGLLNFAGKREREFAERELPKALTSIDHYAQTVGHHGKAKDREYSELRDRAMTEIPQPSPELKQLLATPDEKAFERIVQAGDKAELLANAQQIENAINKRLGQALYGSDGVAASKVGINIAQLQSSQKLLENVRKVESRIIQIEQNPALKLVQGPNISQGGGGIKR